MLPKIERVALGFRIAKNESWKASAIIAAGIAGWLPTALWVTMKFPLTAFLSASFLLVLTFLSFIFMNAVTIIVGLAGYLSLPLEPVEAAPAADSQD